MAVDISSLWDHGKPEASEQRFREALRTASAGDETARAEAYAAKLRGAGK